MSKKFSEHLAEAKKKPVGSSPETIQGEIEKSTETKQDEPKIDDVKVDDSKFTVAVVVAKDPGKIKVKVEKNTYTFSETEVEALKNILEDVCNSKFSSTGKFVNIFRAEKKCVYIPDSTKSVTLCLCKNQNKIAGTFMTFKDTTADDNVTIGDSQNYVSGVMPLGINGTFDFPASEIEQPEKLTMKLCIAFDDFFKATEWANNDDESFKAFIDRTAPSAEVNYESVKKVTFGKYLAEGTFGDSLADSIKKVYSNIPKEDSNDFYMSLQKVISNFFTFDEAELSHLADTIKNIYSGLSLEEAKKFYMDLQKVIANFSFVARGDMETVSDNTDTDEVDNVENVEDKPIEKPRASEIA